MTRRRVDGGAATVDPDRARWPPSRMMGGVQVRPVSFASLIDEIADRLLSTDRPLVANRPLIADRPVVVDQAVVADRAAVVGQAAVADRPVPMPSRQRVAIDGATATDPGTYAGALVDALRTRGRSALHISTDDFLLPASQRFEFGRTNTESFYQGWRDERGLRREVLDPAAPGGSGRVLPALWRADTDRAARADYLAVPPDGVVVVSGQFLLGSGLPFEFAVHLEMSPAALVRRTPASLAWTLPAYARYVDEVAPASFADVVVRLEDPKRPAVVEPDR